MPLRLSRRSKYGAKPTMVDGIRFASMREAAKYRELRWAQQAGFVKSFTCQPRFDLMVNGEKVSTYVGDFAVTLPTGEFQVIDVKGYDGGTPVFKLKARMFEAIYGFPITTVR